MTFGWICDGAQLQMTMFRSVLLVVLVATCGCSFLNTFRPVTRAVTRVTGPTGWYRVTPLLGIDRDGQVTIPRRASQRGSDDEEEQPDDDDYDERTALNERVQNRFRRQLSPLLVTDTVPCQYLAASQDRGKPVYILVHGIGGPGPEWWPVIPTLNTYAPAGIFLFRWNATQQRAEIIDALVTGINRIAACHLAGKPVVLAHSAGGVVVSFAVSRLTIDPGQTLDVLTVAAPLSGAGLHNRLEDAEGENRFMKDLGATKTSFPAAAANVRVTHLRTHYPGDQVMEPKFGQHAPNQAGVGVKGSTEVDLPEDLTHDGALMFVARQWLKQ